MTRGACLLLVLACGACGGPGAKPAPAAAPAPTCAQTAQHVKTLARGDADRAARVAAAFEERCTTDGWAPEVRACIVSTESVDKPKRCKEQLSALQRIALDNAIEEASYVKPKGACEELFALARRVDRCTAMPQRERDAYKESMTALREQYEAASSEDYRASLSTSCRYNVESLVETLDRVCL